VSGGLPTRRYDADMSERSDKNWPAIKQALRANVDVALTLFRNGSWLESSGATSGAA